MSTIKQELVTGQAEINIEDKLVVLSSATGKVVILPSELEELYNNAKEAGLIKNDNPRNNTYVLELTDEELGKMPYGRTIGMIITSDSEKIARAIAHTAKINKGHYEDCWLDPDRTICKRLPTAPENIDIISVFLTPDA